MGVDVAELVRSLADVDVGAAGVDDVREFLAGVARVASWVDAARVAGHRRLSELAVVSPSLSPDHEMAGASRSSVRDAERVGERAAVLAKVPAMEGKLDRW